ncbi:MAG: 50S ribosomal protein L11 methyltransferase, partial [Armatimonadia bacterium]|nr:50S ribosomal protein L11 methyltransferase [Armatimonadia bacterium]
VPVEGGYDLVVANITPPVLGQLMGSIDECLKRGGTFIASGIIEERAVEVLESARSRPRLELIERRDSEGWCGLVFRAGDNG